MLYNKINQVNNLLGVTSLELKLGWVAFLQNISYETAKVHGGFLLKTMKTLSVKKSFAKINTLL